MNSIERHELIERYLLGRASPEDKLVFESLKTSDPDFAREVNLQEQLLKSLRQAQQAVEFRRTLERVALADKKSLPQKPIFRIYPILAVAVSLALLISASWWLFFRQDPQLPLSHQDLFAEYFKLPVSLAQPIVTRDGDGLNNQLTPIDSLGVALSNSWERKEYKTVLTFLEQLEILDTTGMMAGEIAWQKGLVYLSLDRPDEALVWLNQADQNHMEDKVWFIALAYLDMGQWEMARPLLQTIVASNYGRKNQASSLLEKGQNLPSNPDTFPPSASPAPKENSHDQLKDSNNKDPNKFTPSLSGSERQIMASATEEWFIDPDMPIQIRSNTGKPVSNIHLMADAYSEKKYLQVIDYGTTWTPEDPGYAQWQPIWASAYVRSGQFKKGYSLWLEAEQKGFASADLSQWNQLVCLLAELPSERTTFNQLLEKILSDKEHTFYENATRLEKQLPGK
ncbi:MAG: hypothetical protein IPJ06_19395 [Saprospiraceae bacterium]|nr:hypothetical protein [Saprospiraceae bacterium]